jgi:glycosyltransferase involved in cell wall biosynthesis
VHIFGANIGTYHFAREIHALGLPMVVSPIMFSRHTPMFVRTGLACTRALQRLGPGVWSDYAILADICRWADRVMPNTIAEAVLIEKGLRIPADKIDVVPNGVWEGFERGDPALFRKKYGVENFILSVGHIGHPRKNVLRLIQALAAIDTPSVLIGRIIRGAYGDACVQEAAKHKQIRIIDGLENASALLASAYAACDVFVLPSQFETPGIAALEAGLAGAKIVITPHGGTREYFGSMARYVEPGSVDAIRDGIIAALNDPKTQDLREHIKKNFLWRHVATRTLEAYRGVSAGRPDGK